MDCELITRAIDAFVDDELTEGERLEVETHLSGCPACRRLVQERANEKALLRAALPRLAAPESLRRRVSELLDGMDRGEAPEAAEGAELALYPGQALQPRGEPSGPQLPAPPASIALAPVAPPSRREVLRRRLQRLAHAALLLILPLCGYWYGRASTVERYSRGFADLADTVAKHQRDLPVEVAGDQQVVRSWFNGKVPFAVRLPRLEPEAALRGGRLVNLGSREAAYLVYDHLGRNQREKVSVFVFDASDGNRSLLLPLQALDARRQMIGSHEVILQGTHGYSIAVFRDHGLGYAITGDIEEPELLRLISAAVARP